MTEREWREASDMRSPVFGVAAVVAVAAALRFWALGHGIPYAVGADEPQIMERVVRMMKTGDLNPHFFDYPGLYIYVQLVVASLRFLWGAIAGLWGSLDQVGTGDFYLWGRAVTALVGIATVWMVYLVGMRWGARHALLAAGLLAVIPEHVQQSHYVATDVPLTFFTTLTFLLALQAHETASARVFAWAGVAAGLATAMKYSGLVAVLLPGIAAWMTPHVKPSRLRCVWLAVGCCIGTFLVAAPFTWLDLPAFLNAVAGLASQAQTPSWPDGAGWQVCLQHLRFNLSWPALVLMFGGLALAIERALRGPGRTRWILLLGFPIAYFWLIAPRSLAYGRHLLPLLPFACLLVAVAVVSGVSLLRRFDIPRAPRRALISALTIAALLPPLLASVSFNRRVGSPSTHSLAFAWILEHVPARARIAVEGKVVWLPPDRYRVTPVARLIATPYARYVEDGYDYLIASSEVYGSWLEAPERAPQESAAYRDLFEQAAEMALFSESSQRLAGPELRILRVRRPERRGSAH